MEDEQKNKPFLMAPSLQVSRLTKLLEDENGAFTRGELRAKIGIGFTDAQLNRARQRCLKETGKQWEFVDRNGVLKCLNPSERVSVGESNMRRVHRLSKRSLRKLATVDEKELENGEAVRLHSLIAQHGTLAAFSTTKATKAIDAKNVTQAADLPKLLEALK
jgi:hypothetical protein